jgi:AraC family transcriptional regulator
MESGGPAIKTSEAYMARLHRVIDYIEAHLADEIGLETLAREACFSPWHFHRIFTALMDETPDDYVRRVRLEQAARLLWRQPGLSITEVAMRCGFSTPSLFSRNFRRYFGVSPKEWRENKNRLEFRKNGQQLSENGQAVRNDRQASGGSNGYSLGREGEERPRERLEVDVVKESPVRVVCIRAMGGYNPGISKAWTRLLRWAKAHDLIRPETRLIGIPYDNPYITPEDKCRFTACIGIADDAEIDLDPGGIVRFGAVPGGIYASCRYRGPSVGLNGLYTDFYRDWLPSSGFEPVDQPGFIEVYLPGGLNASRIEMDVFDCRVMIPLSPLP